MKGNPFQKKNLKFERRLAFEGNDAYRGEIFGGQQPVRHGEINFGGLDSFLFRFFFYHDHTNRCCRLIVVVVSHRFSKKRRKPAVSTSFDDNGSSSSSSFFLLLRRRSSPTRGKRRRNRKRERKRTHQYSKSVFRSETIDDRESCLLLFEARGCVVGST